MNYIVTVGLGCNFPLLSPSAPSVSWGTNPSVGKLDAKVNKGCTVTAQPWHRVEASCQLPVGVQSRLMGSKKALKKGGNCRRLGAGQGASWGSRAGQVGPAVSRIGSGFGSK